MDLYFFGVIDGQFLMYYSDYGKSKFLSYILIQVQVSRYTFLIAITEYGTIPSSKLISGGLVLKRKRRGKKMIRLILLFFSVITVIYLVIKAMPYTPAIDGTNAIASLE